MIRNYLKIAFRNLLKNFTFSFINLAGLAIGLACCLLIGLYIRFELGYESSHVNKDRLYRYIPRSEQEGQLYMQTYTPPGLAPFLKEKFHEVAAVSRFAGIDSKAFFKRGTEVLPAAELCLADSSLFNMFTLPLIKGNPATALIRPMTLVITKRIADAYFQNEDPIGKTIRYDNALDFEITGVVDDIGPQTHLQFDYLASFVSLPLMAQHWGYTRDDMLTQMDAWNYTTYLLVPEANPVELQERMTAAFNERLGRKKQNADSPSDWLQPLTEIHFTKGIKGDVMTGSSEYIIVFGSVAFFVLLIACFNFMNLTTALALRRAKEVAMRKTMGAFRRQLMGQFLGETMLLVAIAFVLAFQFVELGIPFFNRFMDMNLDFNVRDHFDFLLVSLGVGILTAVVAGSYPAFYLSSFQPIRVLKSDTLGSGRSLFRQALTVLQFGIASFMILGTVVVFQQMRFMKKANLGFSKDQVLTFVPTTDIRQNFVQFKERLLLQPGIESVSISNGVPGEQFGHWTYKFPEHEGKTVSVNTLVMDYDYLDVLRIEVKEGRKLSQEYGTDSLYGYLVNEAAVEEFMLKQPVGTAIQVLDGHPEGRIVGVVKDFHWRSLQNKVEPLVLRIDPLNCWRATVRLSTSELQNGIKAIENEWKAISPSHPFDYTFVDDYFDQSYRGEEKVSTLMTVFSCLAILVACLGLLGLSLFMIGQRKKEIGIRKVLGSGTRDVVSLLSWDFLKLVLIGFLVIIPLSWYVADGWLQSFAYRIEVSPVHYLVTGAGVLLGAFVTVGLQAYKASQANPSESLKCE